MLLPRAIEHLDYKYVKTKLNLVVCIRLILYVLISVVSLIIILCLNIYYLQFGLNLCFSKIQGIYPVHNPTDNYYLGGPIITIIFKNPDIWYKYN